MCSWLQSGNYGFDLNPGPEQCSRQRAKKVVSDSPGLVDFAIGQENSVFNSPDGQVMFLWNQFCSSKSFWVGLVEMTSALVNASFSLPEWQAVKMIFFPPCQGLLRNVKRRYSLGLQTTRTFACLGWQRWNEDTKMVSSVSTFTLNKLAVQLSIFIFLLKIRGPPHTTGLLNNKGKLDLPVGQEFRGRQADQLPSNENKKPTTYSVAQHTRNYVVSEPF